MKGCKILDCPAVSASFVAEATQMGIDVVGCDRVFELDLKVLLDKGKADFDHIVEISLVPHLYNWDFYQSVEGFKNIGN